MSETKTKYVGSGFSLPSVMFLIFMTLKLTGHIAWSWWWITAPLWGGFGLIAVVFLVTLLVYGIAALVQR